MASRCARDKAGRVSRFTLPKKRKANDRSIGFYVRDNNNKMVLLQSEIQPIVTMEQGARPHVDLHMYTDTENIEGPTPSKKSKKDYVEKKKKLSSDWTSIRPQLVDKFVICAAPLHFNCCSCKKYNDKIIRCIDCGPYTYFCKECCDKHHTIVLLHIPEMWNPQLYCFEYLDLNATWKRPDGHHCDQTDATVITVIDERGRQHNPKIEICPCSGSASAVLAEYGLWPASPVKPYVAFSIQFMLTLKAMVLEAQVSLHAFCKAMQQCRPGLQRPLHDEWIANLYRIINWECVLNFHWVDHTVNYLQFAGIDFPDGTRCDACPQKENADKRLIAMDGNMKLVHRAKAGHSVRDPLHAGRFFLPQHAVDDFVNSQPASAKNQQHDCSNFQVESVIRTKNKTSKLDATGVFAAVCNHDFPCSIFNLRHGERMAYPIHMMNSIPNIGLLMYDVGCQLETFMKARRMPIAAPLSVPIFHVFGHKMSCQLQYSPRRTTGAGLFDGEGTERLWSYLGKFCYISKEMTPENRQDLLVAALLNYGQRLSINMAQSLGDRLCRAYILKDTTEATLIEKIAQYPGVRTVHLAQMAEEEKARVSKKVIQKVQETWKEQYAMDLYKYYLHRNQMTVEGDVLDEEATRLEANVIRMERRHKVARWPEGDPEFAEHLYTACEHERLKKLEQLHEAVDSYNHMEVLKKKYGKGKMYVQRILPQLLGASKKVNVALAEYNALPANGPQNPPHRLKRSDVVPPGAEVWQFLCPVTSGPASIPSEKKRELIDLIHLNQRAKEEICTSSKDFGRHLCSLKQQETKLSNEISSLRADPEKTRAEMGTLALLVRNWFRIQMWIKAVDNISSRIAMNSAVDVEAFHLYVEKMNVACECSPEVTELVESLEELNDVDGIYEEEDTEE